MNAAEAPLKLVIFCVECGDRVHATFTGNRLISNQLYREHEWLLSVVDPKQMLLAPVCKTCAPKVYPPELLNAAREAMKGPS